tara:strand:- start:1145 stop:1615 length:471 start_codon:yes stop_codon:yes gene_type:complete
MMKLEKYSDQILEQLQLGVPLTKIAKSKDMPGLSTIYKWVRESEKFANDITEARRTGAQTWLDTAMEILDREDIPPQQFQIVREKLHHIRFIASKLISLYGDRSEVKNTGESSIVIKWEQPDDGFLTHEAHTLTGTTRTSENVKQIVPSTGSLENN